VARLYFDQDVPAGVAHLLRHRGHDIVRPRDLGLRYAKDPEHLLHAALDERMLVTRDNGFLDLHLAWRLWSAQWEVRPAPEHAGIVVIDAQWSVSDAAQELEALLGLGRPQRNELWHYDRQHGWLNY
jgi:hypothetical protein